MRAWAKTSVIVAAAFLNACAIAPGMKMTEPAEVPEDQVVRVQEITLDLLNQLDAERESEVRSRTATLLAMATCCRSSFGTIRS